MALRNTNEAWGSVAKFFHWIIVVLILVQYVLAQTAKDLPLGRQKFDVLNLHKSVGLTIFALAILRVSWRWMNRVPPLPSTLKRYERILARLTHAALYLLLFVMPISGWMLSSASNFPVSWFGLIALPNLVGRDRGLAETLEEVHETLFLGLVCLAILHIAGALKHHFWYKDDVLKRMLPFASLAALVVGALTGGASAGAATLYAPDPAASKLSFVVTQSEGDVEGEFGKFTVRIAFSPDDLASSRFEVEVDTSSVDTGDDDRDTAIRDRDLLDVAEHPRARFVSTAFRRISNNQYECIGKLTLRGVTREVRLTFAWKPGRPGNRSGAVLDGGTTVKRLDFGVGQGDWADTEVVANEVRVRFSVKLTAAGAPAD